MSPSRPIPRPEPTPLERVAAVLAGRPEPFAPAKPADPAAGDAVAAALGCPDVFVVAADRESAERFARALLAESARRGERVLVVANDPDAAVRLCDPNTVRALAPAESPDGLPDHVRGRCSHAVGPAKVAAVRAKLAADARAAADAVARLDATAPAWDDLAAAARRLAHPDRELADELNRLTADARAAVAPAKAAAAAKRAAAEREAERLRDECRSLAPMADARKCGRVTSGLFWKSMFAGDVATKVTELEKKLADAERTVHDADEEAARLDRQAEMDADAARAVRMTSARTAADAMFRRGCEAITAAGLTPPTEPTIAAVEAARTAADAARVAAAAEHAAAAGPLAALDADPAAAARRHFVGVPCVVASVEALADPCVSAEAFARMVALDPLSEATFAAAAAAARADRWVLLTPPGGDGFTARVWAGLHRPAWVRDGDRVVAKLEPLPGPFECEPLADRPEVELRFGTRDGRPVLAEVAFPANTSPAAAVGLLAAEVGEVRLPSAGLPRWSETELACRWPSGSPGGWADVAPGVKACVAAGGLPRVAAVTFDPAAGWDRPAAEAWVEEHILPPARAVALPSA